MARIAFLLMAHGEPDWVIAKARALTAHADYVAIHYDRRAPQSDFSGIRSALRGNASVAFASRVKCGWGEFSLVQATLNLIGTARAAFRDITHYFLISGDCFPTKSRSYFDRFLSDRHDHIEVHDFFESDWIRTGLKEERLIYRHWFNERRRKSAFYTSLDLQKRLGWCRELPKDMTIRIGSQWWALRAETVEAVLDLLRERRDLTRFFRRTWIPDETFFQTLVSHVTPAGQIRCQPPTHLLFSDYGLPVVFHDDHEGLLRGTEQPVARKISPNATALRTDLLNAFRRWEPEQPEGGGATHLYQYLSGRGRNGQRYRQRFWESAIGPRRDVELLIVTAKLWHIGKEVCRSIAEVTGLRNLGYLFDEDEDSSLPMGNLECGLGKRGLHRRAMLNLIADTTGEHRLLVAVDPARVDVITDLAGKVGSVKILMVHRPLSDGYIDGHAERTGLITGSSGTFEYQEVRTALRQEFREAAGALQQTFRGRLFHNDPARPHADNVNDIGRFLDISSEQAEAIAQEAARHLS